MIFSGGNFEIWATDALSERTFKMKLSFEEKEGWQQRIIADPIWYLQVGPSRCIFQKGNVLHTVT